MVTMATNPFCESMGQRVTCMGALHPNPKFIRLFQFKITELKKSYAQDIRLSSVKDRHD